MRIEFEVILGWARWGAALSALAYHVRFLLFVAYDSVASPGLLIKLFYFLSGLGHEAFAVFFVIEGIRAGALLRRVEYGSFRAHVRRACTISIPGLLVGMLLDGAGVGFFNGSNLYGAYPDFTTVTLTVPSLVGNLFMLEPFIVPTFGSNSMLDLLSFLFWSPLLVAAYLSVGRAPALVATLLRCVIALGVLLAAPPEFLVWMAIWVIGLTVHYAGERGRGELALPAALALFGAALLFSRLVGTGEPLVSPTIQHIFFYAKYALVGAGFACFARACYARTAAQVRPIGIDAESFVFFFHFPVMMLVAGIAADVFSFPLKQQPNTAAFAMFALVVSICIGAGVLVARAMRPI